MTAIISKTTLSGARPGRVRTLAAGLATFAQRALAVHLAAEPELAVSVITYQDGTGPPRPAPDAASPPWLPPARTLPLATPAGQGDAVTVIRALIRRRRLPWKRGDLITRLQVLSPHVLSHCCRAAGRRR
jgi:hypothetical protein